MEITQGMLWSIITSILTVFGTIVGFVWSIRGFKADVDTLKKDFGKHCDESDLYRKKADNADILMAVTNTKLANIEVSILELKNLIVKKK